MVQAMYTAYGSTPNGTAATADITTSATDTTAGRLLKVGDFGLGGITPATVTDADAVIASGTYATTTSTTNLPATTTLFGKLVVNSWGSGEITQTWFSNDKTKTELWIRTRNVAGYYPWVKAYHTGNAAYYNGVSASVLAADFDPSVTPIMGAIIESGFNTNGNYTKFADGTMICSGESYNASCSITTAAGTFFRFDAGLLNFPATFVGDVEFTAMPRDSGTTAWLSCRPRTSTTTTSVGLRFYSDHSGTRNIDTEWMAVGRWF